jgi:hypothetical protein
MSSVPPLVTPESQQRFRGVLGNNYVGFFGPRWNRVDNSSREWNPVNPNPDAGVY